MPLIGRKASYVDGDDASKRFNRQVQFYFLCSSNWERMRLNSGAFFNGDTNPPCYKDNQCIMF